MYPTEKWRHKLKSVKLAKILKFADSAIFGDSCPPPRKLDYFRNNYHCCNYKVPRDCNGAFIFRLYVKLYFSSIFENLRMLIGLSFCNLKQYSGSGIFPNIRGKCFILTPDIAQFLVKAHIMQLG
jgi:hypothetical protein